VTASAQKTYDKAKLEHEKLQNDLLAGKNGVTASMVSDKKSSNGNGSKKC